jgi:hypothetical protein
MLVPSASTTRSSRAKRYYVPAARKYGYESLIAETLRERERVRYANESTIMTKGIG